MKITLTVDSRKSVEIKHSDLANVVSWLDDDVCYGFIFSKLANHAASEIRSEVARKTTVPIEVLEQLGGDVSIEVVRQVANNDRALQLLELTQFELMINRDVSVAADIAENLSMLREDVREDVIKILLKHTDPMVVKAVENYIKYLDKMVDDETL